MFRKDSKTVFNLFTFHPTTNY